MNGFGLAAVVVASLAAVVVALLWAMVRVGQQRLEVDGSGMELVELSADEEFAAVQEHNRAGRADLRRQIAEAAERSRRRQGCE